MKQILAEKKDVAMRAIYAVNADSNTPSNQRLEAIRDLIVLCENMEELLEDGTMGVDPDSKYKVKGKIINVQTGQAIPDDEPIFVLRAKDVTAVAMLVKYAQLTKEAGSSGMHEEFVLKRMRQFRKFSEDHPERMKVPDTLAAKASNL